MCCAREEGSKQLQVLGLSSWKNRTIVTEEVNSRVREKQAWVRCSPLSDDKSFTMHTLCCKGQRQEQLKLTTAREKHYYDVGWEINLTD